MNAGLVACTAVVALVVAGAGMNLTSEARSIHTDASLSLNTHSSGTASSAQKGRYKTEGDNCVWVANDGGPNQCTPVTRGRFKKARDASCAWVSNDNGPDQCTPSHGRWKKGAGTDCVWNPNDSGPNQCSPRQPKK